MREVHKMCRICLGQGSRTIFEQSSLTSTLLARDDLSRIAEKLRFVTMLKVNPKENLPQQICDLCIVQLNVSYNFKRLALKNDFQIRQYMIENGMSLSKDDEDSMETSTSLEIHQFQHNVIRTNHYRQITAPEIRRNSTTSSVSGGSTMILNGRESEVAASTTNNFVSPKPMVRPFQIKTEPVDPEDEPRKDETSVNSSPSNASEPASTITVSSATPIENPPMIVINGIINNESFPEKPKTVTSPTRVTRSAPLSVKLGRPRRILSNADRNLKTKHHNLRTIKKKPAVNTDKKKLKSAAKRVIPVSTNEVKRPRGRPRKLPGQPKMTYKTRKDGKKRS